MNHRRWDAQIQRADNLIGRYDFASEGLRFLQVVSRVQKSLYEEIAKAPQKSMLSSEHLFKRPLDFFLLLPHFPAFLSQIAGHAPPSLAESAEAMRGRSSEGNRELLEVFWANANSDAGALDPTEFLVAWAFLQPYAIAWAERVRRDDTGETPFVCPVCSRKPLVGVLRPEGDGAKRSLICMLCAHEWDFRRIVCPACGEEDVHKLAVYTAEAFPHVRVEACDTCKRYIKSVDLTKDGHAAPVVDELATVPLDLWAAEHGYTKLQANLLGI